MTGRWTLEIEQYGDMTLVRRARTELQKHSEVPIEAVGRFAVADPNRFRAVASVMIGAAALGGLSPVTGEAVELTLDLLCGPWKPSPRMPHQVLVVVTAEAVTAFGSDHARPVGPQAAQWLAGTFGVHVSRLPFEIDLMIEWDHDERLQIGGKRGWQSGAASTVQAVMRLADPHKSW